MSGWIDDHGDGSDAVRQVEGESGWDHPSQLFRLLATRLDVGHLDVDHSVEPADPAVRYANRPDRRATGDDLRRLIRTLDRVELPIEELAVELLGPRQV